jgi:hypothetical protein
MNDWYSTFRYDYPFLYRFSTIAVALTFVVGGFMLIPRTELSRVVGVEQMQDRISALRHAIYWQFKSVLYPTVTTHHAVLYGFLTSINSSGVIEVMVPIENEYLTKEFKLADLKLQDIGSIRLHIELNKKANVRLEIYGEMVVVYLGGAPLNIDFIDSGFALPDTDPPSNIVDVAFATYYWNVVRGKKKSSNFYIAH